jgi:hypothetical protein
VTLNGNGRGGVVLPPNRLLPGFAYFEGKGTLKKDAIGGEVNAIVITGKVTIHGDTGVLGTANLRLDLSKP